MRKIETVLSIWPSWFDDGDGDGDGDVLVVDNDVDDDDIQKNSVCLLSNSKRSLPWKSARHVMVEPLRQDRFPLHLLGFLRASSF